MQHTFTPPRRNIILVYSLTAILMGIIAVVSIEMASLTTETTRFLNWITLFIGPAIVIPVLVYQIYAVIRAAYQVEANGIRLIWGFRVEEIPIQQIEWVSLWELLSHPLPRPLLHLPGILSGSRGIPGGSTVEYMATSSQNLVVIATKNKYFAITPEDPLKFIDTFEKAAEIGSLSPISRQSIYPTLLLQRAWSVPAFRALTLSGLALSGGLLAWSNYALPALPADSLVTPAQLAALPILNVVLYVTDLLLGLFFFRNTETRLLSYLLWGTSLFASLIFFLVFYQALT